MTWKPWRTITGHIEQAEALLAETSSIGPGYKLTNPEVAMAYCVRAQTHIALAQFYAKHGDPDHRAKNKGETP